MTTAQRHDRPRLAVSPAARPAQNPPRRRGFERGDSFRVRGSERGETNRGTFYLFTLFFSSFSVLSDVQLPFVYLALFHPMLSPGEICIGKVKMRPPPFSPLPSPLLLHPYLPLAPNHITCPHVSTRQVPASNGDIIHALTSTSDVLCNPLGGFNLGFSFAAAVALPPPFTCRAAPADTFPAL